MRSLLKLNICAAMFAFSLCLVFAADANGQARFADSNVEYSFELPDGRWKMTIKPSLTSPNVEYVYGDRRDGHLEVRKLTVGKSDLISDVMREEEQKLQFRPGYLAGREENFGGTLKGAVFNFEYVGAGRNMAGRFYFVRPNETTVYVLRFVGEKEKLRSLRNQTDAIARSFNIRKNA